MLEGLGCSLAVMSNTERFRAVLDALSVFEACAQSMQGNHHPMQLHCMQDLSASNKGPCVCVCVDGGPDVTSSLGLQPVELHNYDFLL